MIDVEARDVAFSDRLRWFYGSLFTLEIFCFASDTNSISLFSFQPLSKEFAFPRDDADLSPHRHRMNFYRSAEFTIFSPFLSTDLLYCFHVIQLTAPSVMHKM